MASNENIGENSNASGSNNYSETDDEVQVNLMVLLVRIEHVDGRSIEPEILPETTFRELCQFANPNHEPFAVEILSPHNIQPKSSCSCKISMGTLLCSLWLSRKDIIRPRS